MLAQKCELLGAIRLPNNAFKKNAGTEVTSDIIFLQKREKPLKESEIENCNWIHLDKSENGLPINQYFVENPQMVLGTLDVDFRGNTICKADPEKDLREQLNEAIKNIKGSYTAPEFQPELDEKSNDMLLATPDIPNFTYTVVDDKLYYRRDDNLVPLKDSEQIGTRAERRKGMCELADTAKALLNAQVEGMSNDVIESLQAQLNTQYDSFVEKFGTKSIQRSIQMLFLKTTCVSHCFNPLKRLMVNITLEKQIYSPREQLVLIRLLSIPILQVKLL